MKKIVCFLALALAVVACLKEKSPSDAPDAVDSELNEVVFTAAFGESPTTKTQLSGKSVLWSAGDEIKILWDGGSTMARADKAGATANFPATIGAASEYYAVYPSSASVSFSSGTLTVGVPSEQNGAFEDANIALAKTSAQSMVFKNLCALGKFTLTRSDVARIVFRGHENAPLAGWAAISFDAAGAPCASSVASPVDSIVITPTGNAFTPGDYYFASIPGSISAVSFKLTTTSGNTILGKASSSSAALARSSILNFGTLDASGAPTTITLKFDFQCDPLPGWPTTKADGNFTTPLECTYPIDGTDYSFFLAESKQSTGSQYRIFWSTNNATYGNRLSIDARYRYCGIPAIPGYKLVKAELWQVRMGSSDATSKPKVAIADGVPDAVPSSSAAYVLVSGGEDQQWKSGLEGKVLNGPYIYNLSGTSAGTNYYIVSYNTTGCSIGKIEVTYEKTDGSSGSGGQAGGGSVDNTVTVTEAGQSSWTIAYANQGSDATAFVNAFSAYTGCTLQNYLESAGQSKNEILIGNTSRQETKDVLKDISNGFRIAFSGDKLVIAGTDDTWTAVALYEFEKRILKSKDYLDGGTLRIPSDYSFSQSFDDPQTIARLLSGGYTQFTLSAEKVLNCPPEGTIKVAQGAACDGAYYYFVLRNSADNQAIVFKYDMKTGQQVAKSAVFDGEHCNDMTINAGNSTLYVVHGSTAPKVLTPIETGNLAVGTDITISVNAGAVTYNALRNCYAISQGGRSLIICDNGFNKLTGYSRTDDTGYTAQGMGSDDYYIYFPMSSSTDNILVVYDWNGRYVTTLTVNLSLESESMFYAGGNYYVNFHSGGAQLYRITPVLSYVWEGGSSL